MKNKSWRTTVLGIFCIVVGLHSASILWVHGQSIWFNLFYIENGPLALLAVGLMGICAKDHKCKEKTQ